MLTAFRNGHPVTLDNIDRFVDGAAVKRVGELTYSICIEVLDDMHLVPEGKVCSTILKLYNEDAIVVEPAGALSIAALDDYKPKRSKVKPSSASSAGATTISTACRRSRNAPCNMRD
jgi:threonine dehydratase